ncbi:hypothetical protein CDAR_29801 [Caerostris darwini]|uniref:Uncharacterized protein n=1 Tax=Caerostris darwini TaxID=1538125 RepID=A0AAV4QPA0_9ARAC|nr:hypothetical protein CDAR_29801 [Caerostris darwini]
MLITTTPFRTPKQPFHCKFPLTNPPFPLPVQYSERRNYIRLLILLAVFIRHCSVVFFPRQARVVRKAIFRWQRQCTCVCACFFSAPLTARAADDVEGEGRCPFTSIDSVIKRSFLVN